MTDDTRPTHEAAKLAWDVDPMNPEADPAKVEEALREPMREVLALIEEHFTVDRTGAKPILICGLCGEPVTWVSKHLAVKHADQFPSLVVWKLPKATSGGELW